MRRCAQTVALTSSSLDQQSVDQQSLLINEHKDSTDPDHEGAWCTWQGYGHRGHASHIEKVGFLAHDYRVISCGGHDSATYQWRIRGPSKPCATLLTTPIHFCRVVCHSLVAKYCMPLSITCLPLACRCIIAPVDSCSSARLWAGRRRRKGSGWACYSRRLSSLELGSAALPATGSGPRASPVNICKNGPLFTTSACKNLVRGQQSVGLILPANRYARVK